MLKLEQVQAMLADRKPTAVARATGLSYDTVWRVRGPDAPAGARVRLVAVEGVGFVVEPAE